MYSCFYQCIQILDVYLASMTKGHTSPCIILFSDLSNLHINLNITFLNYFYIGKHLTSTMVSWQTKEHIHYVIVCYSKFVHAICIVVTPQLGSVHWGTKCEEQRNFHIWGIHTKFPHKHIPLDVKIAALMLNVHIIMEVFRAKVTQ